MDSDTIKLYRELGRIVEINYPNGAAAGFLTTYSNGDADQIFHGERALVRAAERIEQMDRNYVKAK